MSVSLEIRRLVGNDLEKEYYEEVDGALKNLLATIEGFRRDLDLAKNSDSLVRVNIETKRIFIPPAKTNVGVFSGMAEVLLRMTKAFDGNVELGFGWQKDENSKEKIWTELYIIHENLVLIGAAARFLYNRLEETSRVFHEFNGYNDEEHLTANIPFEADALSVCIVTTRAIIEHTVRLDIDIMGFIEKIRTNDPKSFI